MSRTNSQEHANNDVENMFLQNICLIIPKVVSQACAGLSHYPSQTELDDYVQEINKSFLEGDRRCLRSFAHRSKPQTRLYTIASRHILHGLQKLTLWLQDQSRQEIAKEMGIKKQSVSREKNAVIKKLQRIVGEDNGI